jgi:hypothetical protein
MSLEVQVEVAGVIDDDFAELCERRPITGHALLCHGGCADADIFGCRQCSQPPLAIVHWTAPSQDMERKYHYRGCRWLDTQIAKTICVRTQMTRAVCVHPIARVRFTRCYFECWETVA